MKFIKDTAKSKIKRMLLVLIINKVCTQMKLLNAKLQFKSIHHILFTDHIIFIGIIAAYKISTQLIAEVFLPFQVNIAIAVGIRRIAVQRKTIIAEVGSKI